ncbi:hypothetical protein D9M71_735570 [compost metagenome]
MSEHLITGKFISDVDQIAERWGFYELCPKEQGAQFLGKFVGRKLRMPVVVINERRHAVAHVQNSPILHIALDQAADFLRIKQTRLKNLDDKLLEIATGMYTQLAEKSIPLSVECVLF